MNTFRIVAAGDAAFIVELENRIDPVVNETAVGLAKAIQSAAVPGVRDVVPTYRSVAVHFDPLRTDYDALVARVNKWMKDGSEARPLRSRGGAASCVARRAPSRGECGSSTPGGEFGSATSDGAVELEVAGQERQPVEEHRNADGHDEHGQAGQSREDHQDHDCQAGEREAEARQPA